MLSDGVLLLPRRAAIMAATKEAGAVAIYVDVSSAVYGKAGLKRYAESLVWALRPLLGQRLRLFQNSLGRRGPLPG